MKTKRTLVNISLFFLWLAAIYLVIVLSLTVYVFGKYYFIDIKDIEFPDSFSYRFPFHEPKSGHIVRTNIKTGWEYDVYINAFGSRNLFEVSKEDNNLVFLLGDSHFFGDGLENNETVSYFLNQIDDKRKYINLALRGYNIIDSVERYLLKSPEINPPLLIIFQIVLGNDVYASQYIGNKMIIEEVERDYKYILYPFNKVFTKQRLFFYCTRNIENKIYNDLSEERFVKYVGNPLSKLFTEISKYDTRLMIIAYDTPSALKDYEEKIKNFCIEKNIYFYTLEDLVKKTHLRSNRLPDGHPSANLNKVLASRIKDKLEELGLI